MSNHETLRAWIIEALDAAEAPATALEVSRRVWSHHRDELEAGGDLLYVWQVELRSAAQQMADAGALRIDDATGAWSRQPGGGPVAARPSNRWTPDEITIAVDAYASMWRDTVGGRPARRADVTATARDRTGRSTESLAAMLSNISAVVQELGLDPLPAYPPKSNVPTGVRPAVRAAFTDTPRATPPGAP